MTFAKDYAIQCAGETVWLLPERALWWPAQRMLMVADAHFGKAATFRARGVPAGVFGAGAQQHAPIHARVDPLHEQ